MNREKSINRINELLSRFEAEVKMANANNLYNVNIHSETILIPILNAVYDLNLVNANNFHKNFPGVDLVDIQNGVAFQITSTASSEKIKHTLNEFKKYELYKQFNSLFVYILTGKQRSYSGRGFKAITESVFSFDKDKNILDNTDLIKECNNKIGTNLINNVKELLEAEFTEDKIQNRFAQFDYRNDKEEETELLFPNLLEIEIPQYLYVADLDIDREQIIQDSKQTRFWLGRKSSQRQVVRRAHLQINDSYSHDWHIYENKLITFKDLNDNSEPLRCVVDTGTIEQLGSAEFFDIDDDYKRAFKALLGFCLREKLALKEVEWVHDDKVYRFAADIKVPRKKQVRWKKENQAKKTVISEITSKKEGHIICFKHLAFQYGIQDFGNRWYLSISPTWSFTSNGYRKSRFSKDYTAGIKRLEGNKSVYYYFRFWSYFLNYYDLFDQPYSYFKTKQPFSFKFSPVVPDNNWKLTSQETTVDAVMEELVDEEITLNLFDL